VYVDSESDVEQMTFSNDLPSADLRHDTIPGSEGTWC
jgi:hypothetical protein